MEPFTDAMPVMPFNPLPLIMIAGFLIAFGIVAFAIIRAYIAFKKSNLTLRELGEELEKLDKIENRKKTKKNQPQRRNRR